MNKKNNLILLLLYTFASSVVTIFQKTLTYYFDTFTQNMYRFLSGSLFLLIISVLSSRREFIDIFKDKKVMSGIVLIALIGVIFQTLFVEGLSYIPAFIGEIFYSVGFLLGIILPSIIFIDERQIVNSPTFKKGGLLVLIGLLGTIIGKSNITSEYSKGAFYLFIAVLIGSIIPIIIKITLKKHNPLVVSGIVSFFMTLFFIIEAFLWGNPKAIFSTSFRMKFLLFGSGVYGLLIGISFYYSLIKLFGLVKITIIQRITPFFTGILGYIFLREKLDYVQIIFGTILVFGSIIICDIKKAKTQC